MNLQPSTAAGGPRFLCDAMLGSLARWLRFFGYDALYFEPGPADSELAARAREDGRWLLTKDRELASAGPRTNLVRAEELDGQLVEIFRRLDLRPDATLENARCAECNGVLIDVAREDVADLAPAYVLETAARFRRCDSCGRVYLPGSHGQGIVEKMKQVVARLENADA
jgi:uncharacterized protein with PIN domain